MQIRFDNSLLSTTYCTTKAVLRHVHGLTTERDELKTAAGRAAHTALAGYLKGWAIDNAVTKFALEYETVAPTDAGDRLSFANTSSILRQWMETHPLDSLPFEVLPDLVEVPFELPLSDECTCGHFKVSHDERGCKGTIVSGACACRGYTVRFLFTGRIDAIVRDRTTGKLYVLDHKTTGKIDASQFRNDSQMSGYVWAASQSGHAVGGAYINAIQFSLLPGMKGNGHYKCRIHKRMQPVTLKDQSMVEKERAAVYDECRNEHVICDMPLKTRSPDQLDAWRASALALARRYAEMTSKYSTLESVAAAPMEGSFYYQGCKYCPFGDFCASGKPMQWADSLLIHSPWSPLV
jgi:hypothetical protein